MPTASTGLHRVTAIATDPQRNVDFYHTALGLRLVKKTVNFDAPDTYHLYFGNESGEPGTLVTFFPWPGTAWPPRHRADHHCRVVGTGGHAGMVAQSLVSAGSGNR